MGVALVELGRISEAIAAFEEAVRLTEGQLNTRAYLARGYALAGRRQEAEKIFAELGKSVANGKGSPYAAAMVAVSLGLNEEAIRLIELGYQRREISMVHLKVTPAFKSIASDRRVAAVLKKMGL